MKKIKEIVSSPLFLSFGLLLCVGVFVAPDYASADGGSWLAALISDTDRPEDAVSSDFKSAIRSFINYFLTFLGIIAVAFVIYAGILMVTAQGEDEQITKAKKILIWAAVGIVLILLSYSIVKMVVGAGDITT